MKFYYLLIFLCVANNLTFSQVKNQELKLVEQNLNRIKIKIDSLQKLEIKLKTKLDSLKIENFKYEDTYVLRWDFKDIKAGEKVSVVKVLEDDKKWTIVNTALLSNYKVPTFYLIKEEDLKKKIEIEELKEKRIKDSLSLANKIEQKRLKETLDKRRNELIYKYGENIGLDIFNKKIWIGMTKEMAIESRGNPININRTTGSWGIHEQWVYPGRNYLYFENGILKSWQD